MSNLVISDLKVYLIDIEGLLDDAQDTCTCMGDVAMSVRNSTLTEVTGGDVADVKVKEF